MDDISNTAMANFGQTMSKFGQTVLGQNQVWPNQPFWAKLTRISVSMFWVKIPCLANVGITRTPTTPLFRKDRPPPDRPKFRGFFPSPATCRSFFSLSLSGGLLVGVRWACLAIFFLALGLGVRFALGMPGTCLLREQAWRVPAGRGALALVHLNHLARMNRHTRYAHSLHHHHHHKEGKS